eukprot:TRINITY_DN22898_c0_g1_i2.p1 TRINITY_DN22898_c0_g1~~TRINITY_DN22898_c0_g1_i2.p1  ORF type:complete len:206 (-),score=35.20 TRINITY_DN22898_c0_g1_i2:561-1178(-)
MWMAPVRTGLGEHKAQEFEYSLNDWRGFVQDTQQNFGVNMGTLSTAYEEEQRKYFLQTSLWNSLYPDQVIGQPAIVKELDCKTASIEEIENIRANISMPMFKDASRISGFGGWFDVQFRGCKGDLAPFPVELTTAPSADATTHWGQQVFVLEPAVRCQDGDTFCANLSITRSEKNHRLMDVNITHFVQSRQGHRTEQRASRFYIE